MSAYAFSIFMLRAKKVSPHSDCMVLMQVRLDKLADQQLSAELMQSCSAQNVMRELQ